MFTLKFWKRAADRAIRTFAQTAAGLMAGDGMGLLDVDWKAVASVSGLALLLSFLTSVASAPLGPDKESPDLVG